MSNKHTGSGTYFFSWRKHSAEWQKNLDSLAKSPKSNRPVSHCPKSSNNQKRSAIKKSSKYANHCKLADSFVKVKIGQQGPEKAQEDQAVNIEIRDVLGKWKTGFGRTGRREIADKKRG
jgi:hypothetical protein